MADDARGIHGGLVDRCRYSYYDTIWAFGRSPLDLAYCPFSYPLGVYDPITKELKTSRDTNAISAGCQYGFGATRAMIVEQLRLVFHESMTDGDIALVIAFGWVSFRVAEKEYGRAALQIGIDPPADPPPFSTICDEKGVAWPAGFNGRTVSVAIGPKYIAAMVPYTFTLNFSEPRPMLSFIGYRPIALACIDGVCDFAVQ